MATSSTSANLYGGFLSMPTEVRCQIYDYLLSDPQTITISAGYLTVFGNRIQDRARKTEIPGLPLHLTPLARPYYDASLLSVAKPPEIAIDHGFPSGHGETDDPLAMPAPLALLLTCRLINDELNDWKVIKAARTRSTPQLEGLSLHVSYPYGILVLKSMYPYLLKQARSVHVTGYYMCPKVIQVAPFTTSDEESNGESLTPSSSFEVARTFSASTIARTSRRDSALGVGARCDNSSRWTTSTRPVLRMDSPGDLRQKRAAMIQELFMSCPTTTKTLVSSTLAQLVRTVLPPKATQLVQLTARIVYPGEETYSSVWADDYSPIVHILQSVCGGKIDMTAKRGQPGTGVILKARPQPEARVVSTGWENWRTSGPRRSGSVLNMSDYDQFLTGP